jgi:hypothetical protein
VRGLLGGKALTGRLFFHSIAANHRVRLRM